MSAPFQVIWASTPPPNVSGMSERPPLWYYAHIPPGVYSASFPLPWRTLPWPDAYHWVPFMWWKCQIWDNTGGDGFPLTGSLMCPTCGSALVAPGVNCGSYPSPGILLQASDVACLPREGYQVSPGLVWGVGVLHIHLGHPMLDLSMSHQWPWCQVRVAFGVVAYLAEPVMEGTPHLPVIHSTQASPEWPTNARHGSPKILVVVHVRLMIILWLK